MKVLGLACVTRAFINKLGPQKFSLGLGLVSFGSGDETSLGQHSMYLPAFYLTSPHLKTLPCRSACICNQICNQIQETMKERGYAQGDHGSICLFSTFKLLRSQIKLSSS